MRRDVVEREESGRRKRGGREEERSEGKIAKFCFL